MLELAFNFIIVRTNLSRDNMGNTVGFAPI